MREKIVPIICIAIIAILALYTIVKARRDLDVSTLEEEIKEKLSKSQKTTITEEEKKKFKRASWIRTMILSLIFLCIICICCVPAFSSLEVEKIVFTFGIGGILYIIVNIILIVLTLKDVNKLDNSALVIPCYVREVYCYRGTRVVFVYYDFVKKKYVAKKKMLNTMETRNRQIVEREFSEILVQERRSGLKYISFRI